MLYDEIALKTVKLLFHDILISKHASGVMRNVWLYRTMKKENIHCICLLFFKILTTIMFVRCLKRKCTQRNFILYKQNRPIWPLIAQLFVCLLNKKDYIDHVPTGFWMLFCYITKCKMFDPRACYVLTKDDVNKKVKDDYFKVLYTR